jgi:hypothetical protein
MPEGRVALGLATGPICGVAWYRRRRDGEELRVVGVIVDVGAEGNVRRKRKERHLEMEGGAYPTGGDVKKEKKKEACERRAHTIV